MEKFHIYTHHYFSKNFRSDEISARRVGPPLARLTGLIYKQVLGVHAISLPGADPGLFSGGGSSFQDLFKEGVQHNANMKY